MNQRPTGLNLTKAITGFLQYKSAEGFAPVTVSGYERDLKLWIEYQGDMDVAKVQTTHILAYLNYLRTDYVPRRITGNNDRKLSPKTVYNLYISVASFFMWASKEFQIHNPVKGVPRPRVPDEMPVEPFKKEEIELLIKACDFCEEAETDHRRKFIMQRSTSRRDKAILLTLLDTGLRAGELCALRVGEVDMKTGKIRIRPGDAGKAKGGKGRVVFMGKSARRFVWRDLAEREDGEDPDAPLFLGKFHRVFNRDALRQIINSLGAKAGIKECHPHRFRHTSEKDLPGLLIYHDSFYNYMKKFLQPHFSQVVAIPYTDLKDVWNLEWVESASPDIVIVELTERYLYTGLLTLLEN